MSKAKIPSPVALKLWVAAGGRCEFEGCNQPLWYDLSNKTDCNMAFVAHIIADSPDGPRGDPRLSPLKDKSLDNLMLLCKYHHGLIDGESWRDFPIEMLTEMKSNHERQIEYLTSLKGMAPSHVVLYTPNVGNHVLRMDINAIAKVLMPNYRPAERVPIELSTANSAFSDSDEEFWQTEKAQLNRKFETEISRRITNGDIQHISLFAIAPQPLLVELGHLLSDIPSVDVYQKHREPDTWSWLDEPLEQNYIVIPPEKINNTVALNLSLSATISTDRIYEVLGKDTSIWTITIDTPNNDFLKNKSQLEQFRTTMRFLYDKIKQVHGQHNRMHVFPACPVSIAIELGRIRMPKADLPLVLYDQNNTKGMFIKAFEIG